MASFDPQDSPSVDWALPEKAWITLYDDPEMLETDIRRLADHGYEICRFDCTGWASDKDALRELGAHLGFKDCLGRAGGEDCICDVDIPLDGGIVVALHHYDRFVSVDRPAAQAILHVLGLNARHFSLLGRRFITLVQS